MTAIKRIENDELYLPLRQQKQTHTQRISERQTSTYKRDADIKTYK